MTKLMQWIAGLVFFLAVYIPIVTGMVVVPALEPFEREMKLLPFILVAFFGVCPVVLCARSGCETNYPLLLQIHSLNIVLFRAATIRDCPEAEQELQKDIKEAREDLIRKGFTFRE